MRILLDYLSHLHQAKLTTDAPGDSSWALFRHLFEDTTSDYFLRDDEIHIAWRYFLALRKEIASLAHNHSINFTISDTAKKLLSHANDTSYLFACKQGKLISSTVEQRLHEVGFLRNLTRNQLENVCTIGRLPSAATFSVPGAGKTTEALAFYYLNRDINDRLLIIAPKNAFIAWEEQLHDCVPEEIQHFVRLRGGESNIANILNATPQFMLISYQQFPRVKQRIADFIARHSTFVFLDESHRMKGGLRRISPEAILDISFLPIRKLIMSGTPMPQSYEDLVPQFNFLYPEMIISAENVAAKIQPFYVRTTKAQLQLLPPERRLIQVPLDTVQREVYSLLRSEINRQLCNNLSDDARSRLRKVGKSVMKLMEFVSNPALLAKDIDYAFSPTIRNLLLRTNSPKITYACDLARQFAKQNRKVVIWTIFVENVELISMRLKDLNAEFIHGGVDAGDEDDTDTREGKIKRFLHDESCMVLVANPAAASEGISLHKRCHDAIYVDRSFNAAQYLQSEDRIHRIGLDPNQATTINILEAPDTIDEVVSRRLENKIANMALALNDPSLGIETIPYDYELYDEATDGINAEDLAEIMKYFRG